MEQEFFLFIVHVHTQSSFCLLGVISLFIPKLQQLLSMSGLHIGTKLLCMSKNLIFMSWNGRHKVKSYV
jgi:hypothetical protein